MLEKPLTRRQALKALLAAIGASTAAAFLPEKWGKPYVKTGVLPAHAQISGPDFSGSGVAADNDFQPNPNPFQITRSYFLIDNIIARVLNGGSSAYCVDLKIVLSDPSIEVGYEFETPVELIGGEATFSHIVVWTALTGQTIQLVFDFYNCPAFSGPKITSKTLTFTVVEDLIPNK